MRANTSTSASVIKLLPSVGYALLSVCLAGPTQIVCARDSDCYENIPYKTSAISKAIEGWETSTKTVVSKNLRESIARDACDSAAKLYENKKLKYVEIDAKRGPVVNEYLNRAADPKRQLISVDSLYQTAFGGQVIGQPQIKRWARVDIEYTREVDYLDVSGERMEPAPSILISEGKAVISGFQKISQVCKGEVVASSSKAGKFKC